VGLEGRETTPDLADLNLVMLRQVTGLHMTANPADWWALYDMYRPGLQFEDRYFKSRAANEPGL